MNISDYLRTALINHSLNVAVYTPPTTVWAGLFSTLPPTSAGGGTEISASDYARVTTSWNLATLGSTTNSADVTFPPSGTTLANWNTALGLGLFDSSTAGHLLYYGPLSASVSLPIGSSFRVALANLRVTLA